ncbi:hypothetical protein CR513_16655, partial [Mucuna pruriens]
MMYQPWCIRYLEWEQAQSYEHKFGLTHLFPEFHGLVSNTQQFGIRGSPTSKVVIEVVATDNQRFENKITELTSLVRQLAIGQHHSSPLMRNIQLMPVPLCEKLNLKDTNHYLHLDYNNLCYLYSKNVFATIQDLQTQIGQLSTMVNQLQSKGFGQIPSQDILSPQENMSDITLRSSKELSQQQSSHRFFRCCGGCSSATSIALVITANKLEVEQKEELFQDLKKLGDFYEHLVKHSTLRVQTFKCGVFYDDGHETLSFFVNSRFRNLLTQHHMNNPSMWTYIAPSFKHMRTRFLNLVHVKSNQQLVDHLIKELSRAIF